MTPARQRALVVILLLSACEAPDRLAAPSNARDVPPIQMAPGHNVGSFSIPTPTQNNDLKPFFPISTDLVLEPGRAYRVIVTGTLTFTVNARYASCPHAPPPPPLPGGNTVGPFGFALPDRPYAVVVGIGSAFDEPTTALITHEDGPSAMFSYAGGPTGGVLWVSRPVTIEGGVEDSICPAAPAYDISSTGQSITAVELPPAVITTEIEDGLVNARLTVPWSSNVSLTQGWTWVPEDGGSSDTRFVSGCSPSHTTCQVDVRERGHLRIDNIVVESQVVLSAVSAVLDPQVSIVKIGAPSGSFTVRPERLGNSRLELDVGVYDADDQPIPNRDVHLAFEAVEGDAPGNGGHLHSGSKPDGRLTGPASFNTGSSGIARVVYEAPEVSGEVVVTGQSDGAQDASETITVGVRGLVPLPPGTTYELVGVCLPRHRQCHYGTPLLISRIQELARQFHARYAIRLGYNDVSLELGGLFDLRGTWAPPHDAHRVGRNVDMRTRTLTAAQLKFVRHVWERLGGFVYDETATAQPHYHLRF